MRSSGFGLITSLRLCSMGSERTLKRRRLRSSPKAALTAAMVTVTAQVVITMCEAHYRFPPLSLALLRLQNWLSPPFPTGAYGYSHGLEWAVEAGDVHDRKSLVVWLEADLRYGSGRNEAIFFIEAWRCGIDDNSEGLAEIAELAAAFRGTPEFAL